MKKIPHFQNSSKIYLENRSLSRAKFDTPNTLTLLALHRYFNKTSSDLNDAIMQVFSNFIL